MRLLDREGWEQELAQSPLVGAHAVKDDREVAAVKIWGKSARAVHEPGEGDLDEHDVSALKVGAQPTAVFGSLGHRVDQGGEPVPRLVEPLVAHVRVVEDLAEASVVQLHLQSVTESPRSEAKPHSGCVNVTGPIMARS